MNKSPSTKPSISAGCRARSIHVASKQSWLSELLVGWLARYRCHQSTSAGSSVYIENGSATINSTPFDFGHEVSMRSYFFVFLQFDCQNILRPPWVTKSIGPGKSSPQIVHPVSKAPKGHHLVPRGCEKNSWEYCSPSSTTHPRVRILQNSYVGEGPPSRLLGWR
jgi:hypothetical protein